MRANVISKQQNKVTVIKHIVQIIIQENENGLFMLHLKVFIELYDNLYL